MKARLLTANGEIVLLLNTGRIIKCTKETAMQFIKNYDSNEYISDVNKWSYEITMGEFEGETIAIVDQDGRLIIEHPKFFRYILTAPPINYLTINEYAEKYNKARGIIARFCRDGRLEGAINKGSSWLIPEDAPYPEDTRGRKRILPTAEEELNLKRR